MRVIVIHPHLSVGGVIQPKGVEVEVSDKIALDWIKRGIAKESELTLEVSTPNPKPRKSRTKKQEPSE